MTLFGAAVTFVVAAAVSVSVAMLAFWLHRFDEDRVEDHPSPEPIYAPLYEDHTTLSYCQGCGCRHRTLWMEFDSEGSYRCIVCCGSWARGAV